MLQAQRRRWFRSTGTWAQDATSLPRKHGSPCQHNPLRKGEEAKPIEGWSPMLGFAGMIDVPVRNASCPSMTPLLPRSTYLLHGYFVLTERWDEPGDLAKSQDATTSSISWTHDNLSYKTEWICNYIQQMVLFWLMQIQHNQHFLFGGSWKTWCHWISGCFLLGSFVATTAMPGHFVVAWSPPWNFGVGRELPNLGNPCKWKLPKWSTCQLFLKKHIEKMHQKWKCRILWKLNITTPILIDTSVSTGRIRKKTSWPQGSSLYQSSSKRNLPVPQGGSSRKGTLMTSSQNGGNGNACSPTIYLWYLHFCSPVGQLGGGWGTSQPVVNCEGFMRR